VSADILEILNHVEHGLDTPLANGHGDPGTHPVFDATEIMFNGVGVASHETFVLPRVRRKEWEGGSLGGNFCKTARKPYDVAVTACLCYLSSVANAYSVSSDGRGSNFVAGLAAAREALPSKANILDIPMGVMESDRWTGPWVSDQTGSGYHVGFCVNGKGYVTRVKTGETYCFATHVEMAVFLDAHKQAKFRRGGTSVFGGYGTIEPDIWHASGSFDQLRHQRIARAQSKVLRSLFPVDGGHAEKPPAYVRPDDFARPEDNGSFSYSLSDLLQKVNAIKVDT
jgi:hypothetical protein